MRVTLNTEGMEPRIREAFETLIARINTVWAKEHNGDGTHKAITASSIAVTGAISGASLTVTGAVTGATLSISGAAATGNMTVTGTFSATSTVAWGGGGTISSSGNVPKLDASNTFTGAVQTISNAVAEWRATTGTVTTSVQPSFIGTTTAHDLTILANNVRIVKLFSGGGVTIGAAPTGDDQGAGTLNVDVNTFLDGVAYTNP